MKCLVIRIAYIYGIDNSTYILNDSTMSEGMLGRGNFQIDPAKLRCAAAPPAAPPPLATAASTGATVGEQEEELAELKEQIKKWSKQIGSALNIGK